MHVSVTVSLENSLRPAVEFFSEVWERRRNIPPSPQRSLFDTPNSFHSIHIHILPVLCTTKEGTIVEGVDGIRFFSQPKQKRKTHSTYYYGNK